MGVPAIDPLHLIGFSAPSGCALYLSGARPEKDAAAIPHANDHV